MHWMQLIKEVDKVFGANLPISKQRDVANFAANAAMHLGEW
jgi:hypothetical protein